MPLCLCGDFIWGFSMFALGAINEAIADAIPDHEAIVSSTRRLTWRDLQLRTRRLANLMLVGGPRLPPRARHAAALGVGPGPRRPLSLQRQRVPRGHARRVQGARRARSTSTTATSRTSCSICSTTRKTRGIIYHASFAPRLAAVLPKLPPQALLLQVDDGSGEPLLPGAQRLRGRRWRRRATRRRRSRRPRTISTSSTPAARPACRRACCGASATSSSPPWAASCPAAWARCRALPRWSSARRTAASSAACRRRRSCTARRSGSRSSSCIRAARSCCRTTPARSTPTTSGARSSASASAPCRSSATPSPGRCSISCASGTYDLSSPARRSARAARSSRRRSRRRSSKRCPTSMIFDGFGSSETGAQGATLTTKGDAVAPAFKMDADTVVLDAGLTRRLEPGEDEIGWLARTGYLPLGYFNDREKTQRTYPTVGGVRYAVPGDRAQVAADGTVDRLRPRLGVHQLRRREDLRRGGRAGAQAPSGRVRRRRRRRAERALGRAGHRRRAVPPRSNARATRAARPPRRSTWRATSCPRPSSPSTRSSARRAASPTIAGRRKWRRSRAELDLSRKPIPVIRGLNSAGAIGQAGIDHG